MLIKTMLKHLTYQKAFPTLRLKRNSVDPCKVSFLMLYLRFILIYGMQYILLLYFISTR